VLLRGTIECVKRESALVKERIHLCVARKHNNSLAACPHFFDLSVLARAFFDSLAWCLDLGVEIHTPADAAIVVWLTADSELAASGADSTINTSTLADRF
jgi:hypothetical protein